MLVVCELLAVNTHPAARLDVYFHRFRPRAQDNKEGWGIAWWGAGRPRLLKEPLRADLSDLAAALAESPPTSSMFIVHVRAATVGRTAWVNTHPFVAGAMERDWVFAHNGTVRELSRLDSGDWPMLGDTDSEAAFHHLLVRLEKLAADAPVPAVAATLLDAARELSEYDSRVNFLLSDGRTLYAYHDGHKTMHFIAKRAADLGSIAMDDSDYELTLSSEVPAAEERAVIIATVPLTDEPGWERLEAGEFLVVSDGVVQLRVPPGGAV